MVAPTLELNVSSIKQFEFGWSPVGGATGYRLLERANEEAAFVQIGGDLSGDSVAFTMPLHFRIHASYKLLACDADMCLESAVVDVMGSLAEAVGYFEATFPSVALSNDSDTLAIGARSEDPCPCICPHRRRLVATSFPPWPEHRRGRRIRGERGDLGYW